MTDSTKPSDNRTFVNDASGKALFVNQAGANAFGVFLYNHVQRQLIVNGEVLGLYGAAVDPLVNSTNPTFANLVDFDFGYARISANYPNASPGAYQVRSGDTLQSIAQGAYGDSSLWYRIAEANGIGSSSELKVGQTLNVPNRVSTISNNNSTFKPYDPSEIQGDMTPHMAPPANKGCGGIGKLLMVIVAIVVTIFTAGAMSGVAVGFMQTMGAGLGVMTGGVAGGAIGAAAATAVGGMAMGAIGTMAVAGAVGSVASQAVGLATGTIDKFSWKSVAASALGAGLSAGIPAGAFSTLGNVGGAMARAAVISTLTQGISVAVGLQQRFDWRGVAASAAGAGVSAAVGGALGMNSPEFETAGFGEQLAKRFVTGLAAGVTTAVMRGGHVAVQQVAVDAFGNALGYSIADAASGVGTQPQRPVPQPGELGSGTFAVPGIGEVLGPVLFGGGKPMGPAKTARDILRLEDDPGVITDGPDGPADDAEMLLGAMRSGVPLAGRATGYRATWTPQAGAGRGFVNPAGPISEAGQAFLDNVNETLRETRGLGPTRGAMYRDFAVSGGFAKLDIAGQRGVLAAMVGYSDSINQNLIAGENNNELAADAAVRYATDEAIQSNAMPQWRFGAHSRGGALAGIGVLYGTVRRQYEVPNSPAAEAASRQLRAAAQAEPQVTNTLSEVAAANGGKMAGLEYRLKSLDSLTRKIETDPNRPINDALRYTVTFEEAAFTAGVKNVAQSLKAQGYEQTALRNTFKEGQAYKGINSTYMTPEGQVFELQFHTPTSFQVKNTVNHPFYEQQRVPSITDSQWNALRMQMIQNSSAVPIPPGVSSIKNVR